MTYISRCSHSDTMTYFVKINDANGVRKHILQGSKEIIQSLKGYQHLLDIREEKKEVVQDLQHTYADIVDLVSKLEGLLPEKSLKEVEEFLPKEEPKAKKSKTSSKKKVVAETPKPEPKAPMNEMERLNRALSQIDERLKHL